MKNILKQGNIYSNNDLYNIFKCGNSGGMRKSNSTNTLIVISDHTKSLYDDRWDNGVLYYTGMGQVGDQDINFMQNRTLNESNNNGIKVELFEVFNPKEYIYMGRLELVSPSFQEEQLDREGNLRKTWIFPLKLVDGEVPIDREKLQNLESKRSKKVHKLSDKDLEKGASQGKEQPGKRKSIVTNYDRNQSVVEYAKRRANGICQLCGCEAPFETKNGEPYLEVHHIQWLAQGGSDTIDNVAALCPNCHRKMHSLNLGKDKKALLEKAKERLDKVLKTL